MRVIIVGAGQLAKAVSRALRRRDIAVRLLSRSSGFDVTRSPDVEGVGAAEVVIEATDIVTQKAAVARDFFVRSTRTVNATSRAVGARKHILVSIVNCQDPVLHGNGYYAGKAEQESVALSENENMTIVRSTLWFEFARQNLARLRIGPLALVPAMTVQPVALDAVAEVVAHCTVDDRSPTLYELAGPEVLTLWKMTTALPDKPAMPIPVRVPGRAGRALRDGALLPGHGVKVVGPSFADWTATSTRRTPGPA